MSPFPRVLDVQLKAATPLLLHGADPRKVELRTPPIRGLLRYWLRAAMRGVGSTDEEVRDLERWLFGSAGESACNAAHVRTLLRATPEFTAKEFAALPHSTDPKKKATRFRGADQGTEFVLRLSSRPGTRSRDWELVQALVPVAFGLGGLGQRSRRGFGTIDSEPGKAPVDAVRALIEQLADAKAKIAPVSGGVGGVPKLSEETCVILQSTNSSPASFEQMLINLMNAMHRAHQNGAAGATFGRVQGGRHASAIHARIYPSTGLVRLTIFRASDADQRKQQLKALCDQLKLKTIWGKPWF